MTHEAARWNCGRLISKQAKKFGALADDDEDSVLDEDSLLESPLDKVEPYGMFRATLLSKYNRRLFSLTFS